MTDRPGFFDAIKRKAAQRWDQLEKDPELAAPWYQLFKQVQNPRHVLSELLQNADDAGATEARVEIKDGYFLFEHNGKDFTGDDFASLCRFGYSNKRVLHTIGFRGIGFKSTFSLGDRVELCTPTLSAYFDQKRFTEPHWAEVDVRSDGKTYIRVAIRDHYRQREVEKNLNEWLTSPTSMLFFQNIRYLQIDGQSLHWRGIEPGPVANSEWLVLDERPDQPLLLIRSKLHSFPDEALEEIRQERMVMDKEEINSLSYRIEIVLGGKGRLFVVLPTDVETALPFTCNAPFIQDPARIKIKNPEISPTNRWLLKQTGKLAASVMLEWLKQGDLAIEDRSRAYGLFPDVDQDEKSLEEVCASIVKEAFEEEIDSQPFLLTSRGDLVPAQECIIIPDVVYDIWPVEQVAASFDEKNRPVLCRFVTDSDRRKLLNGDLVDEIDKYKFLTILRQSSFPKPSTWHQLLDLWSYIAPEVTGYYPRYRAKDIRIIPVQGKGNLYAATEVIRLGERKLLDSESDWEFLAPHITVMNQNWTRFLAEKRRSAETEQHSALQKYVAAAYAILREVGLDETSDVSIVIDRIAVDFFQSGAVSLHNCVRLAQITAKLGAIITASFRFFTRDGNLKSKDDQILYDKDGTLEELLPAEKREGLLLHSEYTRTFTSCTRDEWNRWISSGQSGLITLAPLVPRNRNIYSRTGIESELRKRGYRENIWYKYKTDDFVVDDWDFEEDDWRHWEFLASQDGKIWGRIAQRIFAQPENYWSRAKTANFYQIATTGNRYQIAYDPLPSWVLRLQELSCLPDTRSVYRKPDELLMRTPETESLIDVEPFVDSSYDTEKARPLLKLLGVRDIPTGPDRLLDRLRALAKADTPIVPEVEKWYRRLDLMAATCKTSDFEKIKQALRNEKLILNEDGGWTTADAVFLHAGGEDVPGAAVIRASVRELTLWQKIEIAERPTMERVIEWLKGLPSGQLLSPDDLRRVKALLARDPIRIWNECDHWLNLAGEWVPAEQLTYALTMQSLVPWGHLHDTVKERTADLQKLSVELTNAYPFSNLPTLASRIEEQPHNNISLKSEAERKGWLNTVGNLLSRIKLDDEKETNRVRRLALNLAETTWQTTSGLEIIPYLDGIPVGMPRRAEIVWHNKILYVEELPKARLARLVPDVLSKIFLRSEISATLNYCFERSTEDICEYVEQNFELVSNEFPETVEIDQAGSFQENIYGGGNRHGEHTHTSVGDGVNSSSMSTHPGQVIPTDQMIDEKPEEEKGEHESQISEPTGLPGRGKPSQPGITKSDIIERFAREDGFYKQGEDRFVHADGSWIGPGHATRFPWERHSAEGNLIRYYLPKNHCLERNPLELPTDIWNLIDQNPTRYSLILLNADNEPVEMTGVHLRALVDKGKIKLYPGTYRLVYEG